MQLEDGYSHGYTAELVRHYAEGVAVWLRNNRHLYDSVVVHGNSGVSIGFAALMLYDFPLVLVRKDKDSSHGGPIEGPKGHEVERYLILDDFVSSGETVHRVVKKVHALHQNRGGYAECVGVLTYRNSCGTRRTQEVPLDSAPTHSLDGRPRSVRVPIHRTGGSDPKF